MLRATLVMEQHIGHRSYYENLRRAVEAEGALAATWVPVPYGPAGGLIERLPLPGSLRGSLRGRAEVRRGLARPADVRFFNTQVPAVLGGTAARSRPYVIATDITPAQYDRMALLYGHRPERGGPLSRLKHAATLRALRGATRLLPWSAWAARSLVEEYGLELARVEVLPPGVDLARWRPGGPRAEGPLRILFVGGAFARKGGPQLLEAFRALPPGSAELRIVSRDAVAPLPGVRCYAHLQPNSPELLALYALADLFVLPSLAEAFGVAAVEASASGLPSIVSTTGGLPETVADGESGFHVPPGDVAALAARLRLLVDQPGRLGPMGRAARLRAEALFDARRNGARIVTHLAAAAEGTTGDRRPTTDHRPPTTDHRRSTTDDRPPTTDDRRLTTDD